MTPVKGHYLYLFMVLDEYSRKIVHWRISWWMNASEAKALLEGALANENVLESAGGSAARDHQRPGPPDEGQTRASGIRGS